MQEIDRIQARELKLFADSDQQLYNTLICWKVNFQRKIKKGTFENNLAVKGIRDNYIKQIITKYNKEIGSIGIVNLATKEYLAIEFVGDILELIKSDIKESDQ